MCTASIIAVPGGFRLVTNRDEQRTRPEGEAPTWRALADGDGRWIGPSDPTGGGTWVGASDRGLALCLLNVNPGPGTPRGKRTRGGLIPWLIGSGDAREAFERLEDAPLDEFAPFRLVGMDVGSPRLQEASWKGGWLTTRVIGSPPACFVSSGLGDEVVADRLPLFASMVGRDPTPGSQDAFQRHRWVDRPAVSVLMSRPEARTVSITTVEVTGEGGRTRVRMRYEAIGEALG